MPEGEEPYDRVDTGLLCRLLTKTSMTDKVVKILNSLYENPCAIIQSKRYREGIGR